MKTKRARKPKPVKPTFTTWAGCYDDSWKGIIVDEAFAHPAKYARGLVGRIFDYLFAREFITHGDLCADPFGGIDTGGIIAASRSVRWIGCELEPKFVALAKRNFELHRRAWESAGDPLPVVLQGDSRKLRSVLAAADCLVSSPPFQSSLTGEERSDNSILGQQQRGENKRVSQGGKCGRSMNQDYGQSPGQLGSMPPGSVDAVLDLQAACIVSSPPYAESEGSRSGGRLQKLSGGSLGSGAQKKHGMTASYGQTSGNLGNLPAGDVAAVVSSPPYEGCHVVDIPRGTNGAASGGIGTQFRLGNRPKGAARIADGSTADSYGQTEGQIGNSTGETFWAAARDIVAECHAILRPGGVAVWVVKGFVRNKKLVDFPHDWQRLCEACGFVLVEEIHASLVKESRNADLFGGVKVDRTERKSFFRRLAEKKGSPPIDFETVLVMRKPLENGGAESSAW